MNIYLPTNVMILSNTFPQVRAYIFIMLNLLHRDSNTQIPKPLVKISTSSSVDETWGVDINPFTTKSNKMIVNFNILNSLVKCRIICNEDCCLIVIVHRHRSLD